MKKLATIFKSIYLVFAPLVIFLISTIILFIFFSFLNLDDNKMDSFINDNMIYPMVITSLFFIIVLYKKYKNEIKIKKPSIKIVLITFGLGLSLSVLLNMIYAIMGGLYTDYSNTKILYLIILFTSSCLIGPILEEVVFRGIVYNRLKINYSKNISRIIISLIFTLFHTNIIFQIFIFLLSFILLYLYDKYNNLFIAIICHIGFNIASFLITFLTLNQMSIGIILIISFIISSLLLFAIRKTA